MIAGILPCRFCRAAEVQTMSGNGDAGGARTSGLCCYWVVPWLLMCRLSPMNILELSPAQLRRAAAIKEKLDAAQAELASILGVQAGNGLPASSAPARAGKKLHWTQTPQGKARLARAIKRSWRKRRRA